MSELEKPAAGTSSVAIRPLKPVEIPQAKLVVATVCREIFTWEPTPEEILRRWEKSQHLADIDDVEAHYFGNRGTFLVLADGERLAGTGAIRQLSHDTCELKRMWFLKEYRGKGHGARMAAQLIEFAQQNGYRSIRLDTGSNQHQAIRFYRRLGFEPIERYNESTCDFFMEKLL